MEEIREKKQDIRNVTINKIETLAADVIKAKTAAIENRLFEFANFLESKIALLYTECRAEVSTHEMLRKCYAYNKIVVLPAFDPQNHRVSLMKVDTPDKDLIAGPRGNMEPNPQTCQQVPIECIDIAIIPGIAMDEKGGRIGTGRGYYDRLIPDLPTTTRKVGLVFEDQIVAQVPIESHDKHLDIIITEDRIIYKI